jgi:hypothetical protein
MLRCRLALLAFTLVCLLWAPAGAAAGEIVADSGFRPDPDGFSFQNYGDEEGYAGLNAAEMQRLFGPGVCVAGRGADCVLSPLARIWMKSENEGMADGHCYGFATLSELIYKKDLPLFGYRALEAFGAGAKVPYALDVEGNLRLQRSIARAFVMQTLPSVNERAVQGTPTEILEFLRAKLRRSNPESWTMTIFQRGFKGGHAITPYAVEDMGGGIFQIHVYDNNWPGDMTRRLTIDTANDTWNYYAAINPGIPAAEYEGDAKTKTLGLMPVLPGLGVQPCFVCVGREGGKLKYNEIRLSGAASEHAKLVIVDDEGRKTGYVGNRLVNQIPGARILPRTSGGPQPLANGGAEFRDSPLPVFRVPKNDRFKIRIFGTRLRVKDRETLALVGPTYDATVENIVMGPGQVANVHLSPRGHALTYRASRRTRTPAISLGAEAKNAAYRVTVAAIGAPPRSTMIFVKKPKYRLMWIGDKTTATRTYRLTIDRFTKNGEETMTRTFKLSGHQEGFLYYGPLAKKTGVAKIVVYTPDKKRKLRVLPVNQQG